MNRATLSYTPKPCPTSCSARSRSEDRGNPNCTMSKFVPLGIEFDQPLLRGSSERQAFPRSFPCLLIGFFQLLPILNIALCTFRIKQYRAYCVGILRPVFCSPHDSPSPRPPPRIVADKDFDFGQGQYLHPLYKSQSHLNYPTQAASFDPLVKFGVHYIIHLQTQTSQSAQGPDEHYTKSTAPRCFLVCNTIDLQPKFLQQPLLTGRPCAHEMAESGLVVKRKRIRRPKHTVRFVINLPTDLQCCQMHFLVK